jgi:hypothetical protein
MVDRCSENRLIVKSRASCPTLRYEPLNIVVSDWKAVAGQWSPDQQAEGRVRDKTGQEGRGWHIRGLGLGQANPVPSPGDQPRGKSCAGIAGGVYSVGLTGAKTEIPVWESRSKFRLGGIVCLGFQKV